MKIINKPNGNEIMQQIRQRAEATAKAAALQVTARPVEWSPTKKRFADLAEVKAEYLRQLNMIKAALK